MIDPTLIDILTEVVRHVNLPAISETAAIADAQNTRPQSGFSVKPGAVPPEAGATAVEINEPHRDDAPQQNKQAA